MKPSNEQYIVSRLAEIKRLSEILDADEKVYLARIEATRSEYAIRTARNGSALETARKELLAFLKKNRADVFGAVDRIEVAGGVVLRHIEAIVRKARHITVAFLRDKSLDDGIKVEESVDWNKIATWPDDRLTVLGTERKDKETFAYDIMEVS